MRIVLVALSILAGAIGCSGDGSTPGGADACIPETDDELCQDGRYCSSAEVTDRCEQLRSLSCDGATICPELPTCRIRSHCQASPDCEGCFVRELCCWDNYCAQSDPGQPYQCWMGVPKVRLEDCDPDQEPEPISPVDYCSLP